MQAQTTAAALARRILWGLDEAMLGRPRPLRLRCAPVPGAPVVALIEYIGGFACVWVTPFAFYSESTAILLQAIGSCQRNGKVDEIDFCLLHAMEPGRSLLFDWLLDAGFAHSEDGQWLIWRSRRVG